MKVFHILASVAILIFGCSASQCGGNDSEAAKFRQIQRLRKQKRIAENEREDLLQRARELDAKIDRLGRQIGQLCSVLDNPELDAIIVQFSMSKGFAEATLPKTELRHLYVGHEAGYRSLPGDGGDGVLITNAEIESFNGWYERRENAEGPPVNASTSSHRQWQRWTSEPCRDCNADFNTNRLQNVDPSLPITCQTCRDTRFVGRFWYQKNDGSSYISWSWSGPYNNGWFLWDANGNNRYVFHPSGDQFLTGQLQAGQQWKFWGSYDAEAFPGLAREHEPNFGHDDVSRLVAQTYPLPLDE